jgi:hypothetical protein
VFVNFELDPGSLEDRGLRAEALSAGSVTLGEARYQVSSAACGELVARYGSVSQPHS